MNDSKVTVKEVCEEVDSRLTIMRFAPSYTSRKEVTA